MKTATYTTLLAIAFFTLFSCSGTKNTVRDFDQRTTNHQRIAIVPFQSTITLKESQRAKISDEELAELNLAQSKEVQNAVESYLINRDLRVRIQSQSVTNARLVEAGIDLASIADYDVTKLADILGVDAVVTGTIETENPMTDAQAYGLNAAKDILRSTNSPLGALGRSINTTTNRGNCDLALFESVEGDRLWYYRGEINCGAGSETIDVIEKLMKRGARNFPYRT